MSLTTGVTGTHLTRSNLWSNQLKQILEDEMMGQGYVRWMTDFPDGTTFNIPSIGQAETQNIVEDRPVVYTSLDTGNFTFTINNYIGSAMYITEKARQDSFYARELESSFVPAESRAIMEHLESAIFKTPSPQVTGGQTVANPNNINSVAHRWSASGTSVAMAAVDFARAKYSLKKANVPMNNLVAFVDPSVALQLESLSNIVNVSNNPRWEGVVSSGMTTGMKFMFNIFGFDVYESNYLTGPGSDGATSESITAWGASTASSANAAQNLFFSAASDVIPIVGAWRQMPKVDSEYNKDYQREEYVTTARYGVKLYRPENMVCVLSDTTQV